MNQVGNFIQVLDFIVGLFIVVLLLIPGPNEAKRLAPVMLVIMLGMQIIIEYPLTKQALVTIISGI